MYITENVKYVACAYKKKMQNNASFEWSPFFKIRLHKPTDKIKKDSP